MCRRILKFIYSCSFMYYIHILRVCIICTPNFSNFLRVPLVFESSSSQRAYNDSDDDENKFED